MTSTQCNFAVG